MLIIIPNAYSLFQSGGKFMCSLLLCLFFLFFFLFFFFFLIVILYVNVRNAIVFVIIDPQLSYFTVKDLLNSNINIKLNYSCHHFGIKCVSLDPRKCCCM